jgi:phosphoglycerate dehydrogenase-like enzyme
VRRTQRMKVVLFQQHKFGLWNPPDWVAGKLQERFPQLSIVHPSTPEEMSVEMLDAEIAIGSTLTPEQLAPAKKLKWLHSPAAAVHQYMFPEFIASPVLLTNGRSTFAAVVAEHVIALVFALARQIPACVRYQGNRTWGQQLLWDAQHRPREVAGTTLGLVGLGAIGGEVVRRAKALGMNVIAVREHPERPAEGVSAVYATRDISKLLAQADFVVLAAPVTPSTRHVINAERLAQMKPTAFLINVGRGALVDEVALAKALQTKQIAGAGLDVFDEEPLPETSPLWALENLLITPHCAGFIENLWQHHVELISENLRHYLAGEPLRGLVDKADGY